MNTLQSFIELLKKENELLEIDEFFSPELEICEFADRQMKLSGGGKAVLFKNTGTPYPVLINYLGSDKRISLALNCKDLSEKSDEIQYFFSSLTAPKDTFAKKLKTLPLLKDISSFFPKHKSGKGACQEVIESDINIFELPVLKCWPYDGGRFITLPMVNTIDPETKIRNVGMYRVQLLDKNLTALHWHKHKTGAAHFNKYKELNQKMPVAVVLGGDPVYTYSATAPLPEGIDEYLLAGFLRKKSVKLVKCLTQPEIEVPEDADFVIEGYVDPNEDLVLEGPFGDHTGFYSLADYYPKFHITAITHKKNAVYPATIVGVPPMEDAYIGKATEKIFSFPIKMAFVPEMKELHMPAAGVEHNIALVKIKNLYDGNAMKVKNSLWGAGQMMFNKILAVYDGEEDLTDYENFLRDAMKNFSPLEDVYIEKNGVSDVLDHAGRKFASGGKICLDFTKKKNTKAQKYVFGKELENTIMQKYPSITKINYNALGSDIPIVFILLKNKKLSPVKKISEDLVKNYKIPTKILIFADEGIPAEDFNLLTWYASGNIDPYTDCEVLDNQLSGVLCVDSTAKTLEDDNFTRQWPEVVMSEDETIEKVNNKNTVKNNEKLLTSPSIKLKNLRYNKGAVKFFNSAG